MVHSVGWEPKFIERNRWFWPLSRAALRVQSLGDWPSIDALNVLYAELTVDKHVEQLRFAQNVKRRDKRVAGKVNLDALYDARITKFAEVPSRERDWHDFFNALCFATFPRAKRALHARQFSILEARVGHNSERLPGARTREQDALTLFDEGGVVIAAEPAMYAKLVTMEREERQRVLIEYAAALAPPPDIAIVPFGHALFEHLIEGFRCPGGYTQLLELSELPDDVEALLDAVDRALTEALLDPERFANPRDEWQVALSLR